MKPGTGPAKSRWLAAAELGLISSSFSTLISQVTAAQLGRDALVDWMTVAAIPARDAVLTAEPSTTAIGIGIAFHQWADFSWALVFFGLFGRWTARLDPLTILAVALPWAALTSAIEWFVLVPLLPFWQPIFSLQQPYWIGFLVHLSSALIYPVFAWLRWPLDRAPPTCNVRFARRWAVAAIAALMLMAGLAAAQTGHYPIPISTRELAKDQLYIRHMTTHHQQGIELARLALERAQDPHLKGLAALMVASQMGENRIFEQWWRGWFSEPMSICSSDERAAMPGYLTERQMSEAREAPTAQFDQTFVRLMSVHHAGAVAMAEAEWQGRGDLRLRLMAQAIRHAQRGEIALMHGVQGVQAVRHATRNMFASNLPADTSPR